MRDIADLAISVRPVIAGHSSAAAVFDHHRILTDALVRHGLDATAIRTIVGGNLVAVLGGRRQDGYLTVFIGNWELVRATPGRRVSVLT